MHLLTILLLNVPSQHKKHVQQRQKIFLEFLPIYPIISEIHLLTILALNVPSQSVQSRHKNIFRISSFLTNNSKKKKKKKKNFFLDLLKGIHILSDVVKGREVLP